jgi:ABC-2 type transport system permease protein
MVGQSVRGQLQYRLSFALLAFAGFVTTGVEALGLWVLFDRFGMLATWTLPQVAFLYGLVNCVVAVSEALARGFGVFGREFVKTGSFDRLLLRPRGTLLQLAGHEFQLHRVGLLLQGLIVLGWAVSQLDIDWNLTRAGLLVFTALAGGVFFYALFIMQATLSLLGDGVSGDSACATTRPPAAEVRSRISPGA